MKIKIKNLNESFLIRTSEDGSGLLSILGHVLKVNEITVDIIKFIDLGLSKNMIIEEMKNIYDVNDDQIITDLESVITKLQEVGILNEQNLKQLEK